MKSRPRIGTPGEMKFVVAQEHVIDFASGGMPASENRNIDIAIASHGLVRPRPA